jgi:UDP:flavonoid glycosyltransferase YjiC (YdhE family)
MRFIIVAQGSYGDLNPCVGIALRLREQGHQVVFLTSAYFEPLLSRCRFELVPTLSLEDHLRITSSADFRHPFKTFRFLMQETFLGPMRREFAAIEERYEPGRTVVLMLGPGLGARIAHDKLGLPMATLVLYPQLLRSLHDQYGLMGNRTLPLFAREFLRRAFDRRVDTIVGPETNRFRRELGLSPITGHFQDWSYSPQLLIGLFPDWFAARQPDWPNIHVAGFPIFDGADGAELAPEVEAFLSAGEPPWIINALSATQNAREFFERGVGAMRLLRKRAILLSPFAENVPLGLPPGIRYFGYVPHTLLLPRSAGIIHQGGIGTMSKALAVGIPQVIVPVNFDQPYNGAHAASMGVGTMLKSQEFQPERISREIQNLHASLAIAQKCRYYAGKMRGEDGAGKACAFLEEAFGVQAPLAREAGRP